MSRFRFRLPVVLAVLVAVLPGWPVNAEDAATTREVVLPRLATDHPPEIGWLGGSSYGFAWTPKYLSGRGATVRYSVFGGPQDVDSRLSFGATGLSLVGRQLVGYEGGEIVEVDIVSGRRRVIGPAWPEGRDFLGGTGDGWLSGAERVIKTVSGTGESTDFGVPPGVRGGLNPDQIHGQVADRAGAVLRLILRRGGNSNPVLVYLHFATKTYTVLDYSAWAGSAETTLTPRYVYWTTNRRLYWANRSDVDGTKDFADVGRPLTSVTAIGKHVVIVTPRRTMTGPREGPWKVLKSDPPLARGGALRVDRGQFGVVAGPDPADFDLYRMRPGHSDLGARLHAFPTGNPPYDIAADAGRLVLTLDTAERPITERRVTVDAASLSVGGPDTLVADTHTYWPPAAGGDNTAFFQHHPDGQVDVVVRNPASEIERFAQPPCWHTLALSAWWLLSPLQNCLGQEDHSVAVNLITGDQITAPYTSAIDGNTVFYLTPTNELRSHDLVTGLERTLRPAGSYSASEGFVKAAGQWVLYVLHDNFSTVFEAAAVNRLTGVRVAVPITTTAEHEVQSSGGHVSWIDEGDSSVHVYDLDTKTDQVVGLAHGAPGRLATLLAMTDEFVAWVSPEGWTHVLAL